jgi:transposase
MGKLTTVVVTREICDWGRFNNRRAISSYTGLCPGERSSGSKRIPGSVTKRGNPRLRAALVETAWRMVRFQPNYPPVRRRLAILVKGAPATGQCAKKPSWRWPADWRSISGVSTPGPAAPNNSASPAKTRCAKN